MTAWPRNSKCCTAVLLDMVASDPQVDLGPERLNLEDMTTWVEEAASERTALGPPRSIAVVVYVADDDDGVLVRHGDDVGYGYQISIAAGGVVQCAENGALRVSATLPGLTVPGTPYKVVIGWAQRSDGATIRSELALYAFDADAWVVTHADHAEGTVTPTDTLTVGAGWAGADTFSGALGAFRAVRIGRRFISTTELSADFVEDADPPTITGRRRDPLPTSDATEALIAGEGDIAGPASLWATTATRQADQRLAGPLVQCVPRAPALEQLPPSPASWHQATPDGEDGWVWSLRYLWHARASPKVNFIRARAHVRVAEAAGGDTISPVKLRVFTAAHLPKGLLNEPEMVWYRGPVVTIAAPNGAGEWIDLGQIRIAREADHVTHVMLASCIDPAEGEGDDFTTTWSLRALTADPFALDLQQGGDGDLDEKEGA